MCGITGALRFEGSSFRITPSYIEAMRDAMPHRGPDGVGTWISPEEDVGLGFRRLAIIDLSVAANQPLSNEDGSLWIVFNGEIYNHAELRAELSVSGRHKWKTDHSDSEMILHAFEEWGIGCLERFRGMFGMAIWNVKTRELWLVRDRMGVKPVYYSNHSGRLTFASEIKALLKDPDQKREVNEDALYHYLSFLTTPAPDTLFKGIHKLPAGCWMRATPDGRTEVHRYWDPWDHVNPLVGQSEAVVCERVIDELRTAVRYRKVSDVPVGVFLSGGVDSSTNAALFSEGEQGVVKTFTIGYRGGDHTYQNETSYARRMAELVHSDHHERILDVDDLLAFLPEMVRLQDEPIADPVCVPVYYVSKLARDNGVIVCQVGEGADELFYGYPGWRNSLAMQKYDRLPVPRFAKKLGLAAMRAAGRGGSWPYEWIRRGTVDQPIFWSGAEAFTHAEKEQLLSPRLRRANAGRSSWDVLQPIRERFEEKAWEKSDLNWMTYSDLNLRLPELLLMRVDKMSMGVSLEGRVPFLDHKLVELALSIPTAMKTSDSTLKPLLKKAVRGIVPDDLIDRPKQGFGIPVYEWFSQELGVRARKEVMEFAHNTDFLDPAGVQKLLDSGRAPQIWYLFNLALWWKEYIQ